MVDRRALMASLAAWTVAGPALGAKPYRAPRTHFGTPDFEGLWTNASYTELERPDALKALVVTPEEARAWEAKLAKTGGVNVGPDPVGQGDSEFPESGSGLARIKGEIRGSWIVDPPDGQLPYSEEAKKTLKLGKYRRNEYDHPEQRPQSERCLTAEATGAPIINSPDTNVLQIVQTRDAVVLLSEKYHDARIVRIGLGPTAPDTPTSWLGDCRGRWEGDTLVVTTTRLRPGFQERSWGFWLSGEAHIEERFTRIAAGEILYEFAVTDAAIYTRPWRGEMVFYVSRGAMFEYACHEGNYGIVNILGAARLGNQPAPKPLAAP